MRQKHEIGSKILREVIDEELNDLIQLSNAIKMIENYINKKNKCIKNLKSTNDQYERLIYGNSATNSSEQKINEREGKSTSKGVFKKLIGRKAISKQKAEKLGTPPQMVEALDTDLIANLESDMEYTQQ